ncbi:hypothetical protein C4565_06355 [Candidatus Parcubacteria bacterium]|jgi:uncharacterized protein YutE (UPF0331/DUF86 family)|nr:MAG: hypothetical protein C4565_06355 [Candidatus Parcubacteria bacterium]
MPDIDNIITSIWNSVVLFFGLPWEEYLTTLWGIFIVLDGVLVVLFVILVVKAKTFAPPISKRYTRPSLSGLLKHKKLIEKYVSMWKKIQDDAESAPPHSYTTAIVNADILIDELLQDAGFEGKDMGERLGKLNGFGLKTLNGVWRAHRLRNKIVHTSDFEASKHAKDETLAVYENFLKEIKVLE